MKLLERAVYTWVGAISISLAIMLVESFSLGAICFLASSAWLLIMLLVIILTHA